MANILLFSIYFYSLYFIGRGLYLLIGKLFSNTINTGLKIYDIPLSIFYPILAIFFIGNISLLANFFIPVASWMLLIYFFVLLFNFIDIRFKPKRSIYHYFLYNLPILILPISTYNIGFGYDAGLYHLNFQNWIKSSKIIFGLSNLHSRYGYTSFFDYVSSNFWLNNNFILIHFLNLSFLVFFCHIILSLVKNKSDRVFAISVVIYGIFDNFGYGGGKNGYIEIESITKYDTVFGIIFFTSFLLIVKSLNKSKLTKAELSLLLLLLTLSFQLRPTGLLLILPLLVLVYKKYKIFKKNKFTIISFISLNFLWMLKHFIITSCFVFPIQLTCINSASWFQKDLAQNESQSISNALIAFKNYDYNLNLWFFDWSTKFEYNKSTLRNLLLSLLIIFFIARVFTKKENKENQIYLLITTLFYFSFWLYNAPDFRFIIPFTLVAIFTATYNRKIEIKRFKILFLVVYTINLLLLPRIENYFSFVASPLEIKEVNAPLNLTYKERKNSYGVIPSNDEEICWINIKCTPIYSPKVFEDKFLNYNIFKIVNNK